MTGKPRPLTFAALEVALLAHLLEALAADEPEPADLVHARRLAANLWRHLRLNDQDQALLIARITPPHA